MTLCRVKPRPLFHKAACVALMCLYAAPVIAEYVPKPKSHAILRPTEKPGAVAEVEIVNVNGDLRIIGPMHIGEGDFQIIVHMDVGAPGADRFEVEAPDGFIALPPRVMVDESDSRIVYIFPLDALGV